MDRLKVDWVVELFCPQGLVSHWLSAVPAEAQSVSSLIIRSALEVLNAMLA